VLRRGSSRLLARFARRGEDSNRIALFPPDLLTASAPPLTQAIQSHKGAAFWAKGRAPASPDEAELISCPIRTRRKPIWCASPRRSSTRFARHGPAGFRAYRDRLRPRRMAVESKSLKLYLGSFRTSRGLSRGLHHAIALDLQGRDVAKMAANRGYCIRAAAYHRRILQTSAPPQGFGCRNRALRLSRTRLSGTLLPKPGRLSGSANCPRRAGSRIASCRRIECAALRNARLNERAIPRLTSSQIAANIVDKRAIAFPPRGRTADC